MHSLLVLPADLGMIVYLADQVADLPPTNGNLRFILIDSYSESTVTDQLANLQIPTLRAQAGQAADQLADLSPIDLPFDRFLIWQFRQTR